MSADALLDSNVLLYAVSNNPSEWKKRERARALLASPGIGFSTQVFSEFYDNATRKRSPRLTHREAVGILRAIGFAARAADHQRCLLACHSAR